MTAPGHALPVTTKAEEGKGDEGKGDGFIFHGVPVRSWPTSAGRDRQEAAKSRRSRQAETDP